MSARRHVVVGRRLGGRVKGGGLQGMRFLPPCQSAMQRTSYLSTHLSTHAYMPMQTHAKRTAALRARMAFSWPCSSPNGKKWTGSMATELKKIGR